jgi:hypothetical protein
VAAEDIATEKIERAIAEDLVSHIGVADRDVSLCRDDPWLATVCLTPSALSSVASATLYFRLPTATCLAPKTVHEAPIRHGG